MIEILNENDMAAKILVVGVGGAGGNTINRMVDEKVKSVHLVGVNTDSQALKNCKSNDTLQIGPMLTKGLGAGANPEVGEKAATENLEDIKKILSGYDMIFVTCGMGGGTGTGAAPVIAKLSKEMGILTVGVVTKPFKFEAKTRMNNAESGIQKLKENVDTLIIVPNDKLLKIVDKRTTLPDALKKADEVLQQCVQGITDLINTPSLINLDFADVSTVMRGNGLAHVGIGYATGDNKAIEAATMAIQSPLLETKIDGADNIIVNVSGDITLMDANEVVSYIQTLTGEDTNIIFGSMYDDSVNDAITVTVIATGIEKEMNRVMPKDIVLKKPIPEIKQKQEVTVEKEAVETPLSEKTIEIPSFLQHYRKDRY